jgi:hypothetical protein
MKPSFGRPLFQPSLHEELKAKSNLDLITWHDSFPNLAPRSQQSNLTKGMFIKVREAMFRLCKNLSPKLHDYSTWMGSWLPALAATTNQPFGMHFKHVHVPASSPCLPPLLGPKFLLVPRWEFDFDLGLRKKSSIYPCHSTIFLVILIMFMM